MPDEWSPTQDHIHQVEMACDRLLDPEIRKEFQFDPDAHNTLPMSISIFASSFVEEQARRMLDWAITWRRTHRNWDGRFSEWLRIEIAKQSRGKRSLSTVMDDVFGPTTQTLDNSVWRQMNAIRRTERRATA
ncbi:hypothetical protein ASG72_18050 [Bosea sp. Leaf344]|uniref:hypothetical protein n=1 Tax=Bosea sp. Leaf344 TaxID=1736346 RepID=UPI0006FA78BC|nr:hypothetical protein [Bosea sp. Leaf344]KQU49920.1 hypothetical protein ASG72_18050 [Bosea sp. Leaf344]